MQSRSIIYAPVVAAFLAFAGPAKALDIVETAAASDQFTTLVQAVEAAGLVETLQGDGPFTVFAPTDEAFARLPAGTVENLLQPENQDQLVELLTYHVLPGRVRALDASGQVQFLETVQGEEVRVSGFNDIRVNDARVVQADIPADNGVIHAVNAVIMPDG